MITRWHTETYRASRSWVGSKTRTRVINADGKVMIDDLDPSVGAAIVAEHNHVLAAFLELANQSLSDATGSVALPEVAPGTHLG